MPYLGCLLLPTFRYEIMDCFKVLLHDFVITCLIVLVDIYVLICWKLDEMFGNYMLLT